MPAEEREKLRAGQPLSNPKLKALQDFTSAMLVHKGHPPESIKAAFFDAGFTTEQSLEVIVGIATKMISNFTNSIAKTPLDQEVSHLKVT
ncbi:hypothetical protein OAB00_00830 [Akkermansiaceae bacterium]|nr:hypothetical protein [Akkermansiaceae bacterium]